MYESLRNNPERQSMLVIFCQKEFKFPSDLIGHERIHTGDKLYSCETCGKCYNMESGMKLHQITHVNKHLP